MKKFIILAVLMAFLGACVGIQRSPTVEVPSNVQLSAKEIEIRAGNPRYKPVSGWYKTYRLVVFNGSAHLIQLDISADNSFKIMPAQRIDIPFEKDPYVWRSIPLTWRFFRGNNKGGDEVVGTDSDIFRVPPDTERYAGASGEVWHILKGKPLKRMKLGR